MRMSNFVVMHRFTEKNPRFVTLLLELTTGHLVRYVTQCVLARVSKWRLTPLYICQCRAITTELLLTFHRWGHLESNFATRSQANILYNETEIYSHISYYRWVKTGPWSLFSKPMTFTFNGIYCIHMLYDVMFDHEMPKPRRRKLRSLCYFDTIKHTQPQTGEFPAQSRVTLWWLLWSAPDTIDQTMETPVV